MAIFEKEETRVRDSIIVNTSIDKVIRVIIVSFANR